MVNYFANIKKNIDIMYPISDKKFTKSVFPNINFNKNHSFNAE